MSLAYLKARSAREHPDQVGLPEGVVLGADTLCVLDGLVLGQPHDADHARDMLRSFQDRAHDVVTGVALICLESGKRMLFCDEASVVWRNISESQIDEYVDSGDWRGKAGGYNLAERLDAGWDITTTGDPSSIMGLPMTQLAHRLARFCDS